MRNNSWNNINQEIEDIRNKDGPENFISIVMCILHYYVYSSGAEFDSSEDWKRKAGLIKTPSIPEDIDKIIKKGFMKQLKKYNK